MSAIDFEDLDDPRPQRKEPPVVVIGPRGQVNEVPGAKAGRTTCGGDAIAIWRDGEVIVPKRHKRSSYEINDAGEQIITGWVLYEDLCADPEVYTKHGLNREDSTGYYERHMKVLALRDKGNNISAAVGDCSTLYHPEIMRRRGIPADSGRDMTAEQLAAELGFEIPKPAKPETAEDIMAEAPKAKKRKAG